MKRPLLTFFLVVSLPTIIFFMTVHFLECSWEDVPYGFKGCKHHGDSFDSLVQAFVVVILPFIYLIALFSLFCFALARSIAFIFNAARNAVKIHLGRLSFKPGNQFQVNSQNTAIHSSMKYIFTPARWFCTTVILIASLYIAIAIAVALFIANGTLTPGSVMYLDSDTPTIAETLLFIGVGLVVISTFAYAGHRLFRFAVR